MGTERLSQEVDDIRTDMEVYGDMDGCPSHAQARVLLARIEELERMVTRSVKRHVELEEEMGTLCARVAEQDALLRELATDTLAHYPGA